MIGINNNVLSFAMRLLAYMAVTVLVINYERMFSSGMDFLAKYTMSNFLMHTLFAAPLRSVLTKIGIENVVINEVLGLGFSFVGPIVATWIMKKTKCLEFILYPNKFIRKVS